LSRTRLQGKWEKRCPRGEKEGEKRYLEQNIGWLLSSCVTLRGQPQGRMVFCRPNVTDISAVQASSSGARCCDWSPKKSKAVSSHRTPKLGFRNKSEQEGNRANREEAYDSLGVPPG
jgi:hypothetical protein